MSTETTDYRWQTFNDDCPHCGGGADVFTDTGRDNYAGDGDTARCVECKCPGSVKVWDEDSAKVLWHDEPDCDCEWCVAHHAPTIRQMTPSTEQPKHSPETQPVDWQGLATYLAEALMTARNQLSRVEENRCVTEVIHHIDGTDIGCSEDFGVWFTKDGWTTDAIPGMEDWGKKAVRL